MDDLAGLIVLADRYRTEDGQALQMALDKLEFFHYTISAGLAGSYWSNMKLKGPVKKMGHFLYL